MKLISLANQVDGLYKYIPPSSVFHITSTS